MEVFQLFGLTLENFNRNLNEEQCYLVLQLFGWLEMSPLQVLVFYRLLLKYYIFTICNGYYSYTMTFWFIFSVAAWAVIPRYIGVTSGEFLYNSWRIFTLICGIPAFLVAISLFALPESPQFLASHGKPELALKVISKIYETNKGLHYTSFPVSYKKHEMLNLFPRRQFIVFLR